MLHYLKNIVCHNFAGVFFKTYFEEVFLKVLLYLLYRAIQYFITLVDKYNVIADLFHLLHTVSAEDDGPAFFWQARIFHL